MSRNIYRKVLLLLSGTIAGQLVLIVSSPIITRLYQPESIGLVSIFISILMISNVFSSFGYQTAIPLASDDEQAMSIFALCVVLVLFVGLFSLCMLIYFGDQLFSLMNATALGKYKYHLVTSIMLAGLFQVFRYWMIRTKDFKIIAKYNFLQPFVLCFTQIAGFKLGLTALVLSQLLGRSFGLLEIIRYFKRQWGSLFKSIQGNNMLLSAKVYYRFPLFGTWGALFHQLGSQLPVLFLTAMYSPAAAGFYAIAQRVLALPVTTLGKAIAEVLFSEVRQMDAKNTLKKQVVITHELLSKLSLPIVIIIILISPIAFEFVFGSNWVMSGHFAQAMAPMIYMQFVTIPIDSFMLYKKRNADILIFHISMLLVRICSVLVGSKYGDVANTVLIYSLASAFCYMCYLYHILRIINIPFALLFNLHLKSLLWAVALNTPIIVALGYSSELQYLLVAIFASSVMISIRYYLILVALGFDFKSTSRK